MRTSYESVNLEVAGIVNVNKILPKVSKVKTRIIHISESMAPQDIIETLKCIQKSEKEKEEKKKAILEER